MTNLTKVTMQIKQSSSLELIRTLTSKGGPDPEDDAALDRWNAAMARRNGRRLKKSLRDSIRWMGAFPGSGLIKSVSENQMGEGG